MYSTHGRVVPPPTPGRPVEVASSGGGSIRIRCTCIYIRASQWIVGGWWRRSDRERGDRRRRRRWRRCGEKERANGKTRAILLSAFRRVRFVPRARESSTLPAPADLSTPLATHESFDRRRRRRRRRYRFPLVHPLSSFFVIPRPPPRVRCDPPTKTRPRRGGRGGRLPTPPTIWEGGKIRQR